MGLMLHLALAYIVISLLLKKLYEDIVFFFKGNWKYRVNKKKLTTKVVSQLAAMTEATGR